MIGRRAAVADVRGRLVREERLVTLSGPPGIGKSRVAAAAAEELERLFPDGVRCVAVHELRSPEALALEVARALGVEWRAASGDLPRLAEAVRGRHAVLLLDGCDHLVEETGRLVTALLSGCPELRILVTSRQALTVAGESVVVLGPLEHPDPHARRLTAADVADLDAVRLFVRRASRLVPSFRLVDANAAAVAGVTAALGGVPLALELAAARVTVLSPQAILERLGDPYGLLTKGEREAPERQRSLRASVEASAELCTPAELELWARMSVFAGTFELDAVEAVCTGEGIELPAVLDLVDALLDRSVLARDGSDPVRVRYRLLEPLRAYGAELLGDRAGRWRARHREWVVTLAEEAAASWCGPEQRAWLLRLRREHANIAAALEDALDAGPAPLVGPVVALEPFWVTAGRVGEARSWLVRAAGGCGEAAVAAEALVAAGWYAAVQLDADAALGHLEAAERLGARDVPRLRTPLLRLEGAVALWHGRRDDAERIFGGLVAAARRDADRRAEATATLLLGLARSLGGDAEGAATALRASVETTERDGEVYVRSYALTALALVTLLGGEPGLADEAARRALRVKADLDDRFAVALLLGLMACTAGVTGRQERAAILHGAAAGRWRELGLDPTALPQLGPLWGRSVEEARTGLGARVYDGRHRLGGELADDEVLRYAVDGVLGETGPRPAPAAEETPLTARELEVAELVGEGLSNREIAERLVISPRTAQGHVENILRKLGFGSRAQVAAWVVARAAGRSAR